MLLNLKPTFYYNFSSMKKVSDLVSYTYTYHKQIPSSYDIKFTVTPD